MAKNIINKIQFGKKIKEARENIGLTQFGLAEEVKISQNFLGDIERGAKLPSLETFVRLANALKISTDSLLSNSLDNIAAEPSVKYYTDRQLALVSKIIKVINENF